MKLRQSIKNFTQKLSKKSLVIAGVLALGVGLTFGAVEAEFYPDRQPFDYNKPCNPDDSDIYDRCGSLTGPVFNSFINTPSYGDERAFADARRSDQTAAGSYKNVLPDVTEGAQEVVIRTYVHNNANQSLNESGAGVATGTKVRIALPAATDSVLRARSYISADNAALVEDTVDFTASGKFKLEYVPGSAIMYNNGPFKNGTALNDSIVTTGAPIGYDSLNGNLPGCFEYEAVVQIRVKVVPVAEPTVSLAKQVRLKGTSEWKEEVTAKPGDHVEWLMTTEVKGGQQMDNMIVRDVTAPNTELVTGSVKRIDASRNQVLDDAPLFNGGFNMGSYGAGSGFYTMYESKVNGDFEACEARVRNQAFVKSDQRATEVKDTADVIIKKENCNQVEKKVVCDSLNATQLLLKKGESTTFTAQATATNTTITSYAFSVNGQVVQDNASQSYTYTANNPGTYMVSVLIKSPAGDVTGASCIKTVTVKGEEVKTIVCNGLDASKLEIKLGESVELTAGATATNTTIEGFVFVVDGKETLSTNSAYDNKFTYTPTAEGEHIVRVNVKSPLGTVTSDSCVKTVVVKKETQKVAVCESLTASKYAVRPNEKVTFTAKAHATNTTITGYDFSVNDVKGGVSSQNTFEFTTPNTGSYFVRVHVLSEDGQSVTSDECVKSVDVEAEPAVVCETLTADKLTLKVGEKSQLTVKAQATNGATIESYIFTVNGKEVQNSDKPTYVFEAKADGAYQIGVTVKSSAGNATSDNCIKTIDVTQEEKPIYRCDAFTLSKNKVKVGERFSASARITAKNGVTFKQATFTFGDEKTAQDKFVTNKINDDGVVTVDHSYAKVGDYAPRVKIDFADKDGKIVSVEDAACAAQINVTDVKGVTTTTLPDTGAGSIAGIMVALTAAGTALHRRITLRRS